MEVLEFEKMCYNQKQGFKKLKKLSSNSHLRELWNEYILQCQIQDCWKSPKLLELTTIPKET
jgi:hypothetical protein